VGRTPYEGRATHEPPVLITSRLALSASGEGLHVTMAASMGIPLWYLILPLAVIAFCAGLFLLFNLFDMGFYGIESGKTKAIMYCYIGGYIAILLISGMNLATIDWTKDVDFSSLLPSPGANANTFGL
jgi:hypothetical protein